MPNVWIPVTLSIASAAFVPMVHRQQATAIEHVTIQSQGGASLAAEYWHAGAGSPGVLFFPMCSRGAEQGWSPVADRLHDLGVSSLVISFRGSRDRWKADADASVSYFRSRLGAATPLAVAGSSCGVYMALLTASTRHDAIRAVVALTGPHSDDLVGFIRHSPGIAVYSGASEKDGPAAGWARELHGASSNPGSKLVLLRELAHGTDLFAVEKSLAPGISEWLAGQLTTK
jgi:hypothetical protein